MRNNAICCHALTHTLNASVIHSTKQVRPQTTPCAAPAHKAGHCKDKPLAQHLLQGFSFYGYVR